MKAKKTNTLAAEDTKRRAFLPIHMDLVERLTRECDTLSSSRPSVAPDKPANNRKLAA